MRDKGKEALRLPLDQFRVSVLWKADVYADEAERIELAKDTLSVDEVAAHGLTFAEFNTVRLSETPVDFGGLPSSGDTDRLWLDAATFEYEVSSLDSLVLMC